MTRGQRDKFKSGDKEVAKYDIIYIGKEQDERNREDHREATVLQVESIYYFDATLSLRRGADLQEREFFSPLTVLTGVCLPRVSLQMAFRFLQPQLGLYDLGVVQCTWDFDRYLPDMNH